MNYFKKVGYKNIFIIFLFSLIITLVEFLFIYSKQLEAQVIVITDPTCEQIGGVWLEGYEECEYASKEWCGQHGGIFNECASACRHDAEAEICTMQCVPVCVLNIKERMFGETPDKAVYSVGGYLVNVVNGNEDFKSGVGGERPIKIWGVRSGGDLNGDSIDDGVMFLNKKGRNGESLFYVVASLFDMQENKYLGTNALFLGDRIAPKDINVENGEIVVNYADRAVGEPINVRPSYAKTLRAKIEGENRLVRLRDRYVHTSNDIYVESPMPGETIESPLIVQGAARGTWFFEGDFPVILTNWDGEIIAEGYATAQDDWMTEEFVNFLAELNFSVPDYSDRGTLILQKDNPSDLVENDDAFEFGIVFDQSAKNID